MSCLFVKRRPHVKHFVPEIGSNNPRLLKSTRKEVYNNTLQHLKNKHHTAFSGMNYTNKQTNKVI